MCGGQREQHPRAALPGHATTVELEPIQSSQSGAAHHIAEQRNTPELSRRIKQSGERAVMCYIPHLNGVL